MIYTAIIRRNEPAMTGGVDISLAVHFYQKRLEQIRQKQRLIRRRLAWLRMKRLWSL